MAGQYNGTPIFVPREGNQRTDGRDAQRSNVTHRSGDVNSFHTVGVYSDSIRTRYTDNIYCTSERQKYGSFS
jgi:hypothetical protein